VTPARPGRRFDTSLGRLATLGPFHVTIAVAAAFAALLALYLASGVALIPLLLVLVAVAGTDRVLRLHPQGRFHGANATALYVLLPGLFALTTALALGRSDSVTLQLLIGIAVVALFIVTVFAEYLTVDPDAETYELARFGLLLSIYVTALFSFVVAFTVGVPLLLSIIFVGVASLLLTIDMLRELETDSAALLVQSVAVAAVMAECRWVLYYLGLAEVMAGAFMLIVYYVMTGLIQDYVAGRADRRSWLNWGVIFAASALTLLFFRVVLF